MTTLLATSDFNYVWIAAGIGAVIGYLSGGNSCRRTADNLQRLTLQMQDLERKVAALLKHQGIEMPRSASDLSPEVQMLARDPQQKIAAIKRYRQEHPGAGLAEAKERIEKFCNTGQ
jgi:hypothetical protein